MQEVYPKFGQFYKNNFMNKIKNILLYKWTFPRVIRIVLGIILIIQSVFYKEYYFLIPALFFTIMGFFNLGCCSVGWACDYKNYPIKSTKVQDEILYEEVKY